MYVVFNKVSATVKFFNSVIFWRWLLQNIFQQDGTKKIITVEWYHRKEMELWLEEALYHGLFTREPRRINFAPHDVKSTCIYRPV